MADVAEATVDASLAAELEQLSYYSHGDHVDIKIVRVDRGDEDTATVTFDPPAGDCFTHDMPIPVDPSYETEFTALLRTAGENYDTVENLVGTRIPANYTDNGWELRLDPPERTRVGHVKHGVWPTVRRLLKPMPFAAALTVWPVAGIIWAVLAKFEHENFGMEAPADTGDILFSYIFLLIVWSFGVVSIGTVLPI